MLINEKEKKIKQDKYDIRKQYKLQPYMFLFLELPAENQESSC